MKKKYLAIALSLTLGLTCLAGCGAGTGSTSAAESSASSTSESAEGQTASHADETVYGEVTAAENGKISVNVGTIPELTDGATSDVSLDETGETLDITLTDDIELTDASVMAGSMGQGGQMPSGENGASGDGQTPPEMPSGESGASGDGQTPPEMPSGESGASGDGQTPPEMPSGESGASGTSQTPPEMPSGESGASGTSQTPPEMPSGESGASGTSQAPSDMGSGQPSMQAESITADDIEVGDIVAITFDSDGNVTAVQVVDIMSLMIGGNMGGSMGGNMGGGSQSSGVDSYTAVNEYTEDTDISGQTLSSTGTDENAVLVSNGAEVTIDKTTIDRTSSDSTGGDNSSFYGVGAAVLTTDGTTTISGCNITTDAAGGAGVFAYGDGTVNVSDTTITTKQDTSGGIHVAGGGTLNATNCTVETNGESSAAIRSDRGGGTMVVEGGSYTSNGKGSPAIYCTADITVSDADLTANGSEAICIEGLNSISLTDCDLTGNMQDDSQNDCTWNVILYQSMSGDSEVGNSTFTMDGGTLTAKNGGMFYTTNTESTFVLKNVDITYADENDFFLRCTGNANQRGWGTSGSNGADCLFTGIDQEMTGDVIWDSISQLDFYLSGSSTLTGAVIDDESCAGEGGSGYCSLTIDKDSTWIVTGDSTLTTLNNAGTIKDAEGNTVSVVGTDGTKYVTGTSSYTITVSAYSETADMSGASSL